jgi:hypothetical protein
VEGAQHRRIELRVEGVVTALIRERHRPLERRQCDGVVLGAVPERHDLEKLPVERRLVHFGDRVPRMHLEVRLPRHAEGLGRAVRDDPVEVENQGAHRERSLGDRTAARGVRP